MCLSFQEKQLLPNYRNNLFMTNFMENTTALFMMWTFSPLSSCFFFPRRLFSYPHPGPPNTTQSVPSPPPQKTLPHPVGPLTHIPTNTHLRLISSHTHTTLPPTHPTQHLWLITSKEDAINPEKDPLKQIPTLDPDCADLTSHTDPLNKKTHM